MLHWVLYWVSQISQDGHVGSSSRLIVTRHYRYVYYYCHFTKMRIETVLWRQHQSELERDAECGPAANLQEHTELWGFRVHEAIFLIQVFRHRLAEEGAFELGIEG